MKPVMLSLMLVAAASTSAPAAVAASRNGDEICVDSNWNAIPGNCVNPKMSADGRIIIFEVNGQIYLRSRTSNTTLNLGSGIRPSISADGQTAVWRKSATQFGVYRVLNGGLNISTLSVPGTVGINLGHTNALSLDGRFIAYIDYVPDGRRMAFVYDRYLATRTLVSVNGAGALPSAALPNATVSEYVGISGDGQFVAWDTDGDAFSGATAVGRDVIRRNWRAGSPSNTVLTSFLSGGSFTCGQAYHPSLDATGQTLAFQSYNRCIGNADTDTGVDIFARDGTAASFPQMNLRTDGSQSADEATHPLVSADGRYVMFTGPDDLSPPEIRGWASNGVFVRDRLLNRTTRLSLGGYAYFTGTGWSWKEIGFSGSSYHAAISADASYTIYSYNEGSGTRLSGNSLYRSYNASVTANFRCLNANAGAGQSVYVLGSLAELGGWVRPLAVKLNPTTSGSPVQTWQSSITLPANRSFEWKCVRRSNANTFWLNSGERKAGDSVDPLLWSNSGTGAFGNFVGTTAGNGAQTFSGSF